MKSLISAAALATGMLLCGIASAEDVPATSTSAAATMPIKAGGMLKSADGHRVGFIDTVDMRKDGSPIAAKVIVGSRMVRVPASTITGVDKNHFVTSLSYKEVEHL